MKKIKTVKCDLEECETTFLQFNSTKRHCSASCYYKDPKTSKKATTTKNKPINRVSAKRKKLDPVYTRIKKEILAEPGNDICFVEGCNRPATTLEHQKGRKGFADPWARENNLPLLIDKRYLKPCCGICNGEFERNTELSRRYQLSRIHEGEKQIKNY